MVLACQFVVGAASCARTPHVGTGPDVGRVDAQAVESGFGHDPDLACLRALDRKAVVYRRAPLIGGMRTPIEVSAPIGGVALIPRGRRSALMDCVLARALTQADRIFHELGITALTFSAAYDQRTRRGSSQPSAHSYGLAIDVHTIRGTFGEYDVRKHYERGVGRWRGLRRDPLELDGCVGRPATTEGRVLRRLACLLKVHPAFRVLVSPDDDPDHQDHLHIEADSAFFPPPRGASLLAEPLVRWARRGAH